MRKKTLRTNHPLSADELWDKEYLLQFLKAWGSAAVAAKDGKDCPYERAAFVLMGLDFIIHALSAFIGDKDIRKVILENLGAYGNTLDDIIEYIGVEKPDPKKEQDHD